MSFFKRNQMNSIIVIHGLDHKMIARKFRFDLVGLKTAQKRFLNNDRMSRQMYAITCRTNVSGK